MASFHHDTDFMSQRGQCLLGRGTQKGVPSHGKQVWRAQGCVLTGACLVPALLLWPLCLLETPPCCSQPLSPLELMTLALPRLSQHKVWAQACVLEVPLSLDTPVRARPWGHYRIRASVSPLDRTACTIGSSKQRWKRLCGNSDTMREGLHPGRERPVWVRQDFCERREALVIIFYFYLFIFGFLRQSLLM